MVNVIQCPSCRHRLKISDERLGKKLSCPACGQSFEPTKYHVLDKVSGPEDLTKKETPRTFWEVLAKKTGADPTVLLDAVIGGAIGGLIAGVFAGVLYNAVGREVGPDAIGGRVGAIFNGILFGFIIGFAAGTVSGCLVGISSKLVNRLLTLTSKRASIISGVLSGGIVATAVGDQNLTLIGALLGGLFAYAWSKLHRWADSYLPPTQLKP